PAHLNVYSFPTRRSSDLAKRGRGRIVAVMVNNICNSARQNARPQRGLSAASVLIESKVEGSISRLCALYSDVDAIPEVGPLRSGDRKSTRLNSSHVSISY